MNKLTVLNESHHSLLLQAHIHIEVLDVYVHLTYSVLILIALNLELFDHFAKLSDILSILLNACGILFDTSGIFSDTGGILRDTGGIPFKK